MRIFKKTRVSSTGLRLATLVGLAAILSACAGVELDGVKDLEPQGSEFQAELYAGYVKLATREHGEYDFRDSDRFAVKAGSAARGEDVAPADLSERMIAPDKAEELSKARSRLVAILDGSGPGQGTDHRRPCPDQSGMLDAGAGRGSPARRHRRVP